MKPSQMVSEFHAYWRGLADGRPPERRLFDPTAIPHLMPGLLIVELEEGTERLRYRLVGTRSDDAARVSLTGTYVDELFTGATDAPTRFFEPIYRRVGQTGRPEYGEYDWPTPAGLQNHIMFGVFPFLVDGIIRQFFYLEDFTEIHAAHRDAPWWSRAFS